MASRSSESQWRAFLLDLVKKNGAGEDCQLKPRTAFAALSKQFGDDVDGSHRAWCTATLSQLTKPTTRQKGNPRYVTSS